VLCDAVTGRLDVKRLSNARSVALAWLRNAGLVADSDPPAVTDEVAFSLMLP